MVSLNRPGATLGQRQFLFKSRAHQFSGKTTPTQYKHKRDATQPGGGLTPDGTGRWVSSRTPSRTYGSEGRGCRSDGRLRQPGSTDGSNAQRTSLSATATATSLNHAPAGSPAAPGRQRRHVSTAGRRSRSRSCPGEPIGSHSSCCLRRRPRRQPTYPGSRSRPAGRCSTLRFPGNSALEPQFPADSGCSSHDAKLHFANQSHSDLALSLSAHTVEPYLNSASLSSTFSQLPHTAAWRSG